jgi:hypothetical protein
MENIEELKQSNDDESKRIRNRTLYFSCIYFTLVRLLQFPDLDNALKPSYIWVCHHSTECVKSDLLDAKE